MSRASLKELQSLALFGWDRQHGHAPNGELLNMPSHDEHTRFYQTGRQRRKRSSSAGHGPSEAMTPADASKSKPRRPSAALAATKRPHGSRSRKSQDMEASREESRGCDQHLQSDATKYSPVKTSNQVSCAAQSTPCKMGRKNQYDLQRDQISSLSTTGVTYHHQQQSTCTPSLQVMECSVSGCSVQKQNAATRSAGCTTTQSSACKLSVSDVFASDPPSRSPLYAEYTPVLHSRPDNSRVSAAALPAATAPASPSSPHPSPPSPLSMTHSQENHPPIDHHAEKLQLCSEGNVSPGASRPPSAAVADDTCTAQTAHAQQHGDQLLRSCNTSLEHIPTNTSHDLMASRAGPQPSMHSCGALCDKDTFANAVAVPTSPTEAADCATKDSTVDDGDLKNLADDIAPLQAAAIPHAASCHPQAPATHPRCPDKPVSRDVSGDSNLARSAGTEDVHVAALPPFTPKEVCINTPVSLQPVRCVPIHACTEPAEATCAPLPVISRMSASPMRPQPDMGLPHACGEVVTARECSRVSAACSELQEELDRHAMPPPKPKRARTQPLAEERGPETRACEAAGFWSDVWGSSGRSRSQVSLFQDSRHLPLFHPSASLPSGNPWMLTFLP